MRTVMMIGAALIALAPVAASAQYYDDGQHQRRVGETVTTRDRATGNRYDTTTNYDGSVSIRGRNNETGARWRAEVQPDGQQSGVDADGNRWRYNPDTKIYRNSGTGETCRGEGARRSCY